MTDNEKNLRNRNVKIKLSRTNLTQFLFIRKPNEYMKYSSIKFKSIIY